ncbi:hypothetical protein MMC18_004209 [Xylographa bjoerkii]|nr:hypothetical protein [Xylographa bjoerkii]
MFDLFRNSFVYQPLVTATNEIRLIQVLPETKHGLIHCQLEHFPLDEAPPYIALSYTWENPIPGREAGGTRGKSIRVNRATLRIGTNLASALQYLRRHHPLEYVWGDAICIDQKNHQERGQQVLRMARIYETAVKTIAWLGPEGNDSSVAFDLIRSLAREYHVSKSESEVVSFVQSALTKETHAIAWKALEHLLKRKWWTRMWIVQEMVVSRNVDLACGDQLITWDEAAYSIYCVILGYRSILSMLASENIDLSAASINCFNFIREVKERWLLGRPLSLETCLDQTVAFRTSDDRDSIYAILALASDASTLVPCPVYTMTTQDVYKTLVRSYIEQHKSLDIIYLRSKLHPSSLLPSWVPDLSLHLSTHTFKTSLYVIYAEEKGFVQCAAAFTVPLVSYSRDLKVLTCRGICIDIVDGCSSTSQEASTSWDRVSLPVHRNCAYASSEETFSAIWRSLIGDTLFSKGSYEKPPENIGSLFAKHCQTYDSSSGLVQSGNWDRILDHFDVPLWYEQTKDFVICGRTLRDWVADITEDRYDPAEAEEGTWSDFARKVVGLCWDKRLITTEKGYVGMAPHRVQKGDKICILLGSSLPAILRPVRDHHVLVGACYIHGIMFGEAMSLLDEGKVELEDFAIH